MLRKIEVTLNNLVEDREKIVNGPRKAELEKKEKE